MIDAELTIEGRNGVLRCKGAEDRPARIAGKDLTGEENDDAKQQQRQHRQAEALQEVSKQSTARPFRASARADGDGNPEGAEKLKLAGRFKL